MKISNFNLTQTLIAEDLVSMKTIKRVSAKYMNDPNITIEEALIQEDVVKEEDVYRLLSEKLHIPFVDLSTVTLEEGIDTVLPKAMVLDYNIFPLKKENGSMLIAMANPLDYKTVYALNNYTKLKIITAIALPSQIKEKQDAFFNVESQTQVYDAAQEFIASQMAKGSDNISDEEEADIENQPIIKLVNAMFEDAVKIKASDIHIEPMEKVLRIRFRVDGKMNQYMETTKELGPSVISRIKYIGGMNIAEKRVPQDGRLHYKVGDAKIDMRLSTLPSVFGEKVVIRITTALGIKLDKHSIGFLPDNLKKFDALLKSNRGMILLSGATGSGKSTTLYTALSEINKDDVNIVTVENPVEMVIPGITQVDINDKAGLTFASVLRSILRQDPDIIMVGEIRDQETAGIAVNAAITGHLVLSTIHTYNAASSVIRLSEMGIEPYMVSSAMLGVIAQKLVRKLCNHCKEEYFITEDEQRILGKDIPQKAILHRARGCKECNNIGYSGRIAVHEVLPVTTAIKGAIYQNQTTDELENLAKAEGMMTMKENLTQLLTEGVISFETYVDTISEVYQEGDSNEL